MRKRNTRKTSSLCLIEEIKWPKEVKDSSSLCKAEIINSESPSTITEGRWSSRAKKMALTAANASTSLRKMVTWFFRTWRPSPFLGGHKQQLPAPLYLSHGIWHHRSWSLSLLTVEGSIWRAINTHGASCLWRRIIKYEYKKEHLHTQIHGSLNFIHKNVVKESIHITSYLFTSITLN